MTCLLILITYVLIRLLVPCLLRWIERTEFDKEDRIKLTDERIKMFGEMK